MNLASFVEHTILQASCTKEEVDEKCKEVLEHGFYAVCVPPYWVGYVAQKMEEKDPKVVTVVGYPMGYSATAAKVEEIKRAIDDGADEVDVVINVSAIKDGNWNYVFNDINSVITAAHLKGKLIKVILETCLLTESEIRKACEICQELNVDFVKTSTGKNGEGASPEIISLLKSCLNEKIKIQASGGIRTIEAAQELLDAGAHRIGTSTGLSLL
jgi:deoxyribose-phosphate aldolase